jgi:hypothetical protein
MTIHEPGQKSWGEGRGYGKFSEGKVGVKIFLKMLLQICENPERSQTFSEKWHFLAKKVKNFFKNAIFRREGIG